MTPAPWRYGVRKDGTIWMSFGDPLKWPHVQFDFEGSRVDADLICAAPELLSALDDLLTHLDRIGVTDFLDPLYLENARAALTKAVP